MPNIEQIELAAHRSSIIADVRKLVEKYRAIFDWDVPDIDQRNANGLIVAEIHKALDDIENELPGSIIKKGSHGPRANCANPTCPRRLNLLIHSSRRRLRRRT